MQLTSRITNVSAAETDNQLSNVRWKISKYRPNTLLHNDLQGRSQKFVLEGILGGKALIILMSNRRSNVIFTP